MSLRRGQVSSAGVVREVCLREAAFELRPEGAGGLGLAERRETGLTGRAELHFGRSPQGCREEGRSRRKYVV